MARKVWAFPLEWWEKWKLWEVDKPSITYKTNTDLGNYVSRRFKYYGLDFAPYNLRHAWAVRTISLELPLTLAAQQMGHSVAVHTNTYHRWISDKQHQEAYRKTQQKSPPSTQ